MIVNHLEQYPALVKEMMASPFEFYLTGSRYFGNHRPSSDWDFFVEEGCTTHLVSVCEWLTTRGFKRISSPYYNDNLIIEVMRHHSGVDVQIVTSAKTKQMAQKFIKNCPSAKSAITSKNIDPSYIWNTVLYVMDGMTQGHT